MVDATPELMHIHDRMPVILEPDDHDLWLRASADEAFALLRPYAASRLAIDRTGEPWFSRRKSSSAGELPLSD